MRIHRDIFGKRALASLAVFFLAVALSSTAFAQGGTGTLTGTVTDPRGLAVPGAKVVIRNAATGIERPLDTTDAGAYSATFLQPGPYEISITKEGFTKVIRKDITLQVGQILTVDIAMTVGTSVSEITVTGEAPLIEPDRTEISQTVSETLAAALPLNGRRWEQFVFLTPGVTPDGGSGLVSYHGISGLFNNSSVDGTSNQQAFFSETRGRSSVGYTYSLDAVKEFSVSSSAYSAEFGSAAGGQVNAVTKSGSNSLHGDLFYFLRYPSLNALDPFSKGTALKNGLTPTQTEHQRQQFGGSVGGPVIKDKLFYFVNYDGQRRSFPVFYTGPSTVNASAAVNSMIARNCAATVGANSNVTVVGLTAAQCAAAVNYITGNIGPQPRTGNQDIFLGKLDYQATTNNHLNVSFNWMNWKAPNDYRTSPTRSAEAVSANGSYGTHDRFLVGNWNAVISPTVVNDFRFQWSRDFEFYTANFSGPSVSLSSLFSYGMPNALPRPAFPDEHRLQFADSISWVHNKHSFKFGVDISPVHELLVNLFQGGGVYSYTYNDASATTGAATLQSWIADVYNLPLSIDPVVGGADPRLGKHYNTFVQVKDVLNPAQLAGKDDFYDVHYGAYGQDNWKVTPTLTLNLGLRYDLQWIPQPPNPNTNALANYYTNKINISKWNFGPRVGVAWQLAKNTVARAGYGIFYANTTNSLFYNTRVENGVVQKTYNCNASYTPATGVAGSVAACAPLFPNVIFDAPGPALQAPFAGAKVPASLGLDPNALAVSSLAVRGQVPNFLEPMVHEAEIGVEQQLPGSIGASATLMYTKGQHLPVCTEANIAPAGTPFTSGSNTLTPPSTITYNVLPGTFGNGAAAPGGTVTVPFYTSRLNSGVGIISACKSVVRSEYLGLITTVKRRFNHGFELLANYTLSRAHDDGQVLGSTGTFAGSSDAPLDPYNQSTEWGTSDYDQRHRFVASFLYAPSFKVDNGVLSYVVNGFGFGGIVTIASPLPVNALMSSTFSPSEIVGGVTYTGVDGGATGGAQLNASNTASRIPNFPKNSFRGPTQVRAVDFRVTRDFKFYSERYKLQVIAEAFNLFNHTIITDVNAPAYAYGAPGSAACGAGTTNPCLVPQSSFLTQTATSNGLYGARQLQFSAKLFF